MWKLALLAEAEVPSHILHNPLFLMLLQIELTCSHAGEVLHKKTQVLIKVPFVFREQIAPI